MQAIPKVIFLYDNDAMEVRFSDDSRLELSPCGAAMVFHPPSKPGDHPRQRFSQQLHKRTQFVTSEHKQKVIQALDFRNRFAKRPYLCEDLLNKHDIVSLYASVDSIKWPKSFSQAKIDIMPDGSRKVTSLDEFCGLIVSPHGQDFSVCYLCKISSDHVSFSSPQPLSPPYMPAHTSKHSLEKESKKKATEAVVYPYSHEGNEYHGERKPKELQEDSGNMNLSPNKQEQDQSNERLYDQQPQQRNVACKVSSSLPIEHFTHPELSCQEKMKCCMAVPNPSLETKSHLQPSSDIQSDSMPVSHDQSICQADCKFALSDRCSPLPHEISSISRSSSPDGLRMTIDSDTTLTHDTTDNETIRYRQRHSSPTQMCLSVDDIQLPFAKLVEMKSSLVQGSFLSLPPGNQQQLTSAQTCHSEFNELPVKNQENASNISSVDSLKSSSINEKSNSDSCHSTTLCQSHQDMIKGGAELQSEVSTEKADSENCSVHSMCIGHEDNKAMRSCQTCYNLDSKWACFPSNTQRQGVFESPSNQVTGDSASIVSTALPLAEINPAQSSDRRTAYSISSQLPSSVIDSQLESKSSSKRKYIWTTSHGSRNDCPKEWTHPLMLALQGSSAQDSGGPAVEAPLSHRDNKSCIPSSLPRTLPLTCPFQHTHRSTSSQHSAGDRSGDSSSNVGVFHRDRLKVVLSEGIIYRLIPASGMTVVEIYPGDGSVLISQGAKALFFTHYIPRQGQLEERMYSLKSLPPRCSKEFRPIEKMLKTANRFLHICLSWDKRTTKKVPPCWQREMVAVVEPLSSSILEECVIDGLGKFTAYTNGRVRIVFDDRTSLNMVSDFSPRTGSTVKIPNSDLEAGMVRLLLPSGNYVLVEKNSIGPYCRYLRVANEWTDWVNTSPAERHKFYAQQSQPALLDQAAKLELKKINCFNYILENTFQPIKQQNQSTNQTLPLDFPASSHKPVSSYHENDVFPSAISSGSPHVVPNTMPGEHGLTVAYSKAQDKTSLGFLSVKQALAQTSNLIRDIEDFLEENKT